MNLRSKVLLVLCGVLIAYTCVEYVIVKRVVLPAFENLEREEASKDMKRCVDAVKREIHHLDYLCFDWAAWDDTYEFVQEPTSEYEAANLIITSFTGSNLNTIQYYDPNGNKVWGESYDMNTEELLDIAEFDSDSLPLDHPVLLHEKENVPLDEITVTGVFLTNQGPLLISSRPIITSNYEGPIQGSLVMGRLMNEDLIETFVEQTGVDFVLWALDDEDIPKDARTALGKISEDEPVVFEKRSDELLQLYTSLDDIQGKPALLLRADIPRHIMARGTGAVQFALISALIASFLLLAALYISLQRIVVGPITRMTSRVVTIIEGNELSRRLEEGSSDEIGTLSHEFNEMVGRLSERTENLEGANRRLIDEISQRKRAELELEHLSRTDGLTEISNRRVFDEVLEQEFRAAMRSGTSLGLIMIDIDHFKQYNDHYGHQAGDDCLKRVAATAKTMARRPRDLPTRYGGEEFAIILVDTDIEGAQTMAENIRASTEALSIEHAHSDTADHVTISLGVASMVPSRDSTADALLAKADKALYAAKESGRNCVKSAG